MAAGVRSPPSRTLPVPGLAAFRSLDGLDCLLDGIAAHIAGPRVGGWRNDPEATASAPGQRSRARTRRDSQPEAPASARGAEDGLVIDIDPDRFEELVTAALDDLPEQLGQMMSNVAVTVEHRPGPPGLLGLYQGMPLTSRTTSYAGVLPDRITIYRQAICATSHSESEVADQVRRTVIHEVGHHFGISDHRLRELGW
jgi:predicted Zn-dependent protease with MMP-like domain